MGDHAMEVRNRMREVRAAEQARAEREFADKAAAHEAALAERKAQAARDERRQRWRQFLLLGASAQRLQGALEFGRLAVSEQRALQSAVGVITLAWRRCAERLRMRMRRRKDQRQLNQAANLIVRFARDHSGLAVGMNVVMRKYRRKVIHVQRMWRSFSLVTEARIQMLRSVWEELVEEEHSALLRLCANQLAADKRVGRQSELATVVREHAGRVSRLLRMRKTGRWRRVMALTKVATRMRFLPAKMQAAALEAAAAAKRSKEARYRGGAGTNVEGDDDYDDEGPGGEEDEDEDEDEEELIARSRARRSAQHLVPVARPPVEGLRRGETTQQMAARIHAADSAMTSDVSAIESGTTPRLVEDEVVEVVDKDGTRRVEARKSTLALVSKYLGTAVDPEASFGAHERRHSAVVPRVLLRRHGALSDGDGDDAAQADGAAAGKGKRGAGLGGPARGRRQRRRSMFAGAPPEDAAAEAAAGQAATDASRPGHRARRASALSRRLSKAQARVVSRSGRLSVHSSARSSSQSRQPSTAAPGKSESKASQALFLAMDAPAERASDAAAGKLGASAEDAVALAVAPRERIRRLSAGAGHSSASLAEELARDEAGAAARVRAEKKVRSAKRRLQQEREAVLAKRHHSRNGPEPWSAPRLRRPSFQARLATTSRPASAIRPSSQLSAGRSVSPVRGGKQRPHSSGGRHVRLRAAGSRHATSDSDDDARAGPSEDGDTSGGSGSDGDDGDSEQADSEDGIALALARSDTAAVAGVLADLHNTREGAGHGPGAAHQPPEPGQPAGGSFLTLALTPRQDRGAGPSDHEQPPAIQVDMSEAAEVRAKITAHLVRDWRLRALPKATRAALQAMDKAKTMTAKLRWSEDEVLPAFVPLMVQRLRLGKRTGGGSAALLSAKEEPLNHRWRVSETSLPLEYRPVRPTAALSNALLHAHVMYQRWEHKLAVLPSWRAAERLRQRDLLTFSADDIVAAIKKGPEALARFTAGRYLQAIHSTGRPPPLLLGLRKRAELKNSLRPYVQQAMEMTQLNRFIEVLEQRQQARSKRTSIVQAAAQLRGAVAQAAEDTDTD
ncbi:hypothetical protein FNF27_00787 [Cafeteria roenbergensis]|uniref:Uncharacterized protein n=1 Tax=Cafeteria roenbergensis TaxID=33653 RepID=A0A5A8ELU7_CAFRO|nr:hypothetical protein FNF27_00787 [Cafeteria roenbergensis]